MMRIFWGKISNYSERTPHEAAAQQAEAHNQFYRARATDMAVRRRSATTAMRGAAALAGVGLVLLLALLIGCAPSGSSSSNGTPRPIVAIGEETIDCTTGANTVCTFNVEGTFEGSKSDAADDGDWIEIMLAANTTYRISVDPAGDSTMATVTIYNPTATAATPIIGSDMLWTATDADTYYIGVVLDAVGEYTLTITAAPEGTNSCNSMDAEADCDSDGHANSMDNCPAVANPQQTNSDNPDNDIATGGDALGDVCDVDDDDDGVNDFAADGTTILDKFPLNACAAFNSDADVLPDSIIDPAAANAGRCTDDELSALIGVLDDSVDTCEDRASCTDDDDDGDSVLDTDDIDLDNDGLIEIANLDALNNIRYNLAGTTYDTDEADGADALGSTTGAPTAEQPACDDGDNNTTRLLCGYELTRSLNFATATDYDSGMVNMDWRPNMADANTATNAGWQPLGHDTNGSTIGFQGTAFSAILEGNGNTISGLFINPDSSNEDFVGLIGSVASGGGVRNLGLTDVFVMGDSAVGGLAGQNDGTISTSYSSGSVSGDISSIGGLVGWNREGTISTSYSSGSVSGGDDAIGGLVGWNKDGIISASYSSSSVSGGDDRIGGLVGQNDGTISTSYSSGSVTNADDDVGGLVGQNNSTISASYSSGRVMGTGNVGGLVGNNPSAGRIATSWWDTTTSLRTFGFGNDDIDDDNMADSGEANRLATQGLTTAQMRASMGTFPNFSAVVDIIGTANANLLGSFSAAWDYTANCYPRLKRWTGAGTDGVIGTNDDTFHASELLPGQGTPGTGGACTTS